MESKSGPEVTLVNFNLMRGLLAGRIDTERYAPLGLLYILACLERAGIEADFIDHQLSRGPDPFRVEVLLDALADHGRVVAFSCMGNLLPFTLLSAKALKEADPEVTIVLGGAGPTPVARKIVERFPFVDAVFPGEGEESFLRWYRERAPGTGVCMRVDGDVVDGGYPTRNLDLDKLPMPAYHRIPMELYDGAPSIITQRGCPWRCTFCTETSLWQNKVVFRSVGNVLDEIELLYRVYGHRMVLIQDDQFTLPPRRAMEFCAGLEERGIDRLKWKCFGRVDLGDERLMARMAEAGCVQMRYGIESGSDRVLKKLRKGFTIAEAEAAVAQAVRRFPSVHASFMYGFPFESGEDFEETVAAMRRFEDLGATILPFMYAPLPGSEIVATHPEDLRFHRDHTAIFVATGHEDRMDGKNAIQAEHQAIFDLVERHPDIFSGFYHYNMSEIVPKIEALVGSGFIERKLRADVANLDL